MIEICSDNLTTQFLKEDIGHFRNMCQHTNMELLKNVLKKLKERSDEILKQAEETDEARLKELLSSQNTDTYNNQASAYLSGDMAELNPEDLLELANLHLPLLENTQSLLSQVNFFLDISKIILDTLRSNSKMLDFYNQTAMKVFEFCSKYSYKIEYQRLSETLHSHFYQI